MKRMQEIQEEAKVALEKAQENMKKYVDRHRDIINCSIPLSHYLLSFLFSFHLIM